MDPRLRWDDDCWLERFLRISTFAAMLSQELANQPVIPAQAGIHAKRAT